VRYLSSLVVVGINRTAEAELQTRKTRLRGSDKLIGWRHGRARPQGIGVRRVFRDTSGMSSRGR
jgi:hypothetical protein